MTSVRIARNSVRLPTLIKDDLVAKDNDFELSLRLQSSENVLTRFATSLDIKGTDADLSDRLSLGCCVSEYQYVRTSQFTPRD
jgi:hypothetical protein